MNESGAKGPANSLQREENDCADTLSSACQAGKAYDDDPACQTDASNAGGGTWHRSGYSIKAPYKLI